MITNKSIAVGIININSYETIGKNIIGKGIIFGKVKIGSVGCGFFKFAMANVITLGTATIKTITRVISGNYILYNIVFGRV